MAQQPQIEKQMQLLPTDFALIVDGITLIQMDINVALSGAVPLRAVAKKHLTDIQNAIVSVISKIATGHHEFFAPEIEAIQMGLAVLTEQSGELLQHEQFRTLDAEKTTLFDAMHNRALELQTMFDQATGQTFKLDELETKDFEDFLTHYDPNDNPTRKKG